MPFDTIPSAASLKPKTFKAHTADADLDSFKQLLSLSRIGPKTYENQTANVKDVTHFGITHSWLDDAKHHWESQYDWRRTEDRINSFPNFTVPIEDSGFTFEVHFVALFSKKADAAPLTLLHGWPGSFLEFLDVLDLLRDRYDEQDLPFNVIVPSLPGYGYSNGPPLDKDFTVEGLARVVDKLMIGLGFKEGYVTQGGDIGSLVSRVLGATSEACKAVHLNMCICPQPDDVPMSALSDAEKKVLERGANFGTMGSAYGREHGTKPATVGLVLSSSPIALLAWIGEKFLQWSDTSPPLDAILDSVTLYWFTESFPRSIFPYRQFFSTNPTHFHHDPKYYIKKPLGYSWYPKEIAPPPHAWVAKTGNLVWHREHSEGGHFAAMEKPELFVRDMEDFIGEVWHTTKTDKLLSKAQVVQ